MQSLGIMRKSRHWENNLRRRFTPLSNASSKTLNGFGWLARVFDWPELQSSANTASIFTSNLISLVWWLFFMHPVILPDCTSGCAER
jgi:hypothetical protein